MAAQNSQTKIIKSLLYHKSDPNICDLVKQNIYFYKKLISLGDLLYFIVF